MPVQIGTKASNFSDPTGLLSDCHRRIEMFLSTLRAAADFGGRQLGEDERRALDAALRYFREAAPKHNADGGGSLFPRLRSVNAPEVEVVLAEISRLEQEHHWAAPLHAEVDRLGQQWLLDGQLAGGQAQPFTLQSANWTRCTALTLSTKIKSCFRWRPDPVSIAEGRDGARNGEASQPEPSRRSK